MCVLLDAGTDVGIPFSGSAPDLGAFEAGPVTFVAGSGQMPVGFVVEGNYPNPFNPSTTIVYDIPDPGTVMIRIYDLVGRPIREMRNDHAIPGRYRVSWDGRDARFAPVASGVYFAFVQFGEHRSVLKMQLLK